MTLYPGDTRTDATSSDPKARRAMRDAKRHLIRKARRTKAATRWDWTR